MIKIKSSDLMRQMGMKTSAFYKLLTKINVVPDHGFLSQEEASLVRRHHEHDQLTRRGVTRIWYRVSIWDGMHYIIKYPALSKGEAIKVVTYYKSKGELVKMKPNIA